MNSPTGVQQFFSWKLRLILRFICTSKNCGVPAHPKLPSAANAGLKRALARQANLNSDISRKKFIMRSQDMERVLDMFDKIDNVKNHMKADYKFLFFLINYNVSTVGY